MKTYVLMLSHSFPATHNRRGEPTYFKEKFFHHPGMLKKLHTIRSNYPLWLSRIRDIQRGTAVLSVREWLGAPYRSKQRELARLTAADEVGCQLLLFHPDADGCFSLKFFDIAGRSVDHKDLAHNDGLSLEDWREWFKDYDLSKPLAVVHFTKFRY